MRDGFDEIIARYGLPHTWGPWHWWVNCWRLVVESIQIRILLDIALRCPDDALSRSAIDKLGAPEGLGTPDELSRLDGEWPGRGCFQYAWLVQDPT